MCLKCLREGGHDVDDDTGLDDRAFCSVIVTSETKRRRAGSRKKNHIRGTKVPITPYRKIKKAYQVHAYPLFYEDCVHFRELSPRSSPRHTNYLYAALEDVANAATIIILPSFNQSILEYMSLVKYLCDCGATVYGLEQRGYGINYDCGNDATSDTTLDSYISDYIEVLGIIGSGKSVKVVACGIGCLVALSERARDTLTEVDALYLYEPIGHDSPVACELFNGPVVIHVSVGLSYAIFFRKVYNMISRRCASAASDCTTILTCERRYLRNAKRSLLSRQLYNDYPENFAYRTVSNALFDEVASQLQVISNCNSIAMCLAMAIDSSDGHTFLLPVSIFGTCAVVYKSHEAAYRIPSDLSSCARITQFFKL